VRLGWVAVAVVIAACGHETEAPREPAVARPADAAAAAPAPAPVAPAPAPVAIAVTADLCERSCRNYVTLSYWNKHDPQLAAVPADQRERRRADLTEQLATIIGNGLQQCIEQCTASNNVDQVTCMATAASYDAVRKCAESEADSH
jgi:hypothetical protein